MTRKAPRYAFGSEQLTLREIADRTGLQRGTLWKMAQRDEDLVEAVLRYKRQRLYTQIAASVGVSAKTLHERMRRGMRPLEAALKPARVYRRKEVA